MKLSVVLPNYNQGHWLPESLGALLAQERQPDEIIVVDDASTDNSLEVIAQFQRRSSLIRLIRHPVNRGAPAAINTGIAAAEGDYIYCAGADDRVLPGLFRTALAALESERRAGFFCAQVALIGREGQLLSFRPFILPASRAEYISTDEVRRRIRHGDNWIVGPSVVYRRSTLAAIGNFDEALGSLCDGLAGRLLAFRHGFCFDPAVLSAWRVYPESYSNRTALSVDSTLALIERARGTICDRFPEDIRSDYAALFERRYRFNTARLWLVWQRRNPNIEAIARIAGFGPVDRTILKAVSCLPMRHVAVVLYLAARLWPLSPASVFASTRRLLRRPLRRLPPLQA